MATIKTSGSRIQNTATKTATLSSKSSPVEPPKYPVLEEFTKPMPTMDADLERHYKFKYFFGMDEVRFQSRNINETCGQITNTIPIGNVDTIELETVYQSSPYSSVEFSIIDQDKEIPIIPVHDEMIKEERIFFGLPLRFPIDKTKPYEIKKDGVKVSISIEEAMRANDGLYTISYTPKEGHQLNPKGEEVQLKVIMRLYDKSAEPPFVKNAFIRCYGGDALWTDRL